MGVATFAVLSFHMVGIGVPQPLVPVIYAVAMLVDGAAALATGSLYDRVGPKTLLALPVLSAMIPLFAYSGSVAVVVVGVILWGMTTGVQESTMRAYVADILPSGQRATGYGFFALVTGAGTMLGGAIAGWLYGPAAPARSLPSPWWSKPPRSCCSPASCEALGDDAALGIKRHRPRRVFALRAVRPSIRGDCVARRS